MCEDKGIGVGGNEKCYGMEKKTGKREGNKIVEVKR
jgi:hypothetical protein